jgi:hypothetical protein
MIEVWKEWWSKQHNTQVGGYNRMEGYMYDAFKAGWDAALEKITPLCCTGDCREGKECPERK